MTQRDVSTEDSHAVAKSYLEKPEVQVELSQSFMHDWPLRVNPARPIDFECGNCRRQRPLQSSAVAQFVGVEVDSEKRGVHGDLVVEKAVLEHFQLFHHLLKHVQLS